MDEGRPKRATPGWLKGAGWKAARVISLPLVLLLAACDAGPTPMQTATSVPAIPATISPSPAPTATEVPPSPTPIPLAGTVNGEPITLADFQTQLALFQAAQDEVGTNLATEEAARRVFDDLVAQVLLSQAAKEAGFVVTDDLIADRTDQLASRLGGGQALEDWQAAHGYTPETFRRDLSRAIATAWMRDLLVAQVPQVAEQVHARQILLYNSEDAQRVLARLQSGAAFTDLAKAYDPLGFGDLGWFPRGYLTEPEVEAAAFSLQPEEISGIVETRLGFHILQVIERMPARPLAPDALQVLQSQALDAWLKERRESSQIQVLSTEIP